MHPFTPPEHYLEAFHCPNCNAYALQAWHGLRKVGGNGVMVDGLTLAACTHCKKYTLWVDEELIYPEASGVALPNPDLNDDIKDVYLEACNIVNKSPRGAAALLRLSIQMLCKELGGKGKNINDDIALLVKNGLSPRVQQSLDIVSVIGNNSVHPGQMDMEDNREVAIKLFQVVNLIAQVMITQPKQIEELYSTLPQSDLDAIQKRDTPRPASAQES